MGSPRRIALLLAAAIAIALPAAAACGGEPAPAAGTLEIPSGREPDASVRGTVTYRERIPLTAGARLVVELRETFYADAPAPLIARQTIADPGQVPITFRVGYSRDDIDPRGRYSIQADIIESDGRLAFTNDTAYEVVTRGNPDSVEMLLVLVKPPPELLGAAGPDWRSWVEVPAFVTGANLIPGEADPLLRISYHQSTVEGCARPGNQSVRLDGDDIVGRVTLMQPPPTPWAIACDEQVVELEAVEPVPGTLERGRTYRVVVNDRVSTTFTLPAPGLGHTAVAESPIESAEIEAGGGAPTDYRLLVVSGLPRGSSCSQVNGYEIRRRTPHDLEVVITHHEVADPSGVCTADYPVVETTVPLGSEFERGAEYTVEVNSEITRSFIAR